MNNKSYNSLVARFYDAFLHDNVEDVAFFSSYFQKKDKSILELATGTARLLLPLLRNGYKIDGLDNSTDMLEIARNKINKENLHSNLYNESMTDFNLQKKYDYVFIGCGSFMIVDYINGIKTINCIKNNLVDNGEVLLDLFIPWDNIQNKAQQNYNIVRDVIIEDDRCIVYEQFSIDVHEQTKYGKYKYEYYKNGKLLETEINELNIRWYYPDEIINILNENGFKESIILINDSSYIKNEAFKVSAKKKVSNN